MPVATHTSACGSLTIMPTFFVKEFGITRLPRISGMCLVTQVLYTTSAQTKIPVSKLRGSLSRSSLSCGSQGTTLGEICDILSMRHRITFTATRHERVNQVEQAVCAGAPVIAVFDSDFGDVSGTTNWEGVVSASHVRRMRNPDHGDYLHALLVVGVDVQARMMIMRESRSRYSMHNGLIKVPIKPLVRNPDKFAFIQLDAHLTK